MEINLSLMLEQLADELYGVLQEKHLAARLMWRKIWWFMEIRKLAPGF